MYVGPFVCFSRACNKPCPLPCSLNNKVNILHIRALVKADTVVLFDTYGSADSRLHSVFLYHLEVRSARLFRRARSFWYSTI